jgi:mono/diheme cytochrome c family protein
MRVMTWAQRQADLKVNAAAKSRRIAAFFLFVFAVLALGSPAPRAQQSADAPPAGNAQNGKKLFMSDGCYECHGRMGQGAAQTGAARIGPPQLSFEGFQSYVRSPKINMPPYTAKAIPDTDLADIYAYLKSIPMPPKGKDIPLLNK